MHKFVGVLDHPHNEDKINGVTCLWELLHNRFLLFFFSDDWIPEKRFMDLKYWMFKFQINRWRDCLQNTYPTNKFKYKSAKIRGIYTFHSQGVSLWWVKLSGIRVKIYKVEGCPTCPNVIVLWLGGHCFCCLFYCTLKGLQAIHVRPYELLHPSKKCYQIPTGNTKSETKFKQVTPMKPFE